REIDGDLYAVAARSYSDAGRAAVRREQHHGRRQNVREQSGELVDAPVRIAVRHGIERAAVMRAEAGESGGASIARLPVVELGAHEVDALPQRACRARGAALLDLDHGRRNLDDTGVEVDCAAVRKVVRGAAPVHEVAADELARRAEDLFGLY